MSAVNIGIKNIWIPNPTFSLKLFGTVILSWLQSAFSEVLRKCNGNGGNNHSNYGDEKKTLKKKNTEKIHKNKQHENTKQHSIWKYTIDCIPTSAAVLVQNLRNSKESSFSSPEVISSFTDSSGSCVSCFFLFKLLLGAGFAFLPLVFGARDILRLITPISALSFLMTFCLWPIRIDLKKWLNITINTAFIYIILQKLKHSALSTYDTYLFRHKVSISWLSRNLHSKTFFKVLETVRIGLSRPGIFWKCPRKLFSPKFLPKHLQYTDCISHKLTK